MLSDSHMSESNVSPSPREPNSIKSFRRTANSARDGAARIDKNDRKNMLKLPTIESDKVLNMFKLQVNEQGRDIY